jgi:hypothetical protein
MHPTITNISMIAFALTNGLRVVGFIPQIVRIHRDPHGAAAVSILTWATFASAHIATVWYALASSGDYLVAAVFALNSVGCLAIVGATALKRQSIVLSPSDPVTQRCQLKSATHSGVKSAT